MRRDRALEGCVMKITVVGAALMIGAVILAVVVIRTLADRPQSTLGAS
jgi:hypothetical protein